MVSSYLRRCVFRIDKCNLFPSYKNMLSGICLRWVEGNWPRAVEILIPALMQLDSFTIQLFFNDKLWTLHLLNCFFNIFGWTFAKHGHKRREEANCGILKRNEASICWGVDEGWPLHLVCVLDPKVPTQPSWGQSRSWISLVRQGERQIGQCPPLLIYSCLICWVSYNCMIADGYRANLLIWCERSNVAPQVWIDYRSSEGSWTGRLYHRCER